MLALKMAQQRDGLQRAVILKQREEVILPIAFEGIGHRAPVNDIAVGRKRRVDIEASRGSLAEPGTGGRGSLTMGLEV